MKASSQWVRRAFLWSGAGATAAAMIVAGSSAQAARTSPHASPSHSRVAADQKGPGYPQPGGIYKPFTNCPLLNPLLRESTGGDPVGCVAGEADAGSIKIGNITTKITHPVIAQFGIWDPVNAAPSPFTGGILPPPNGLAAQLVNSPELVPGGLLKALGCPSSKRGVERLCREAKRLGGKYLRVFAMAQSAGPITNFELTTWTQPLKFKLMNPLLGSYCYIGSNDNPVAVNPVLSGNLTVKLDPNPKLHPKTGVIAVEKAVATDTTFTAPGVTGCGPGGSANIAIDEAIDTSVGLPSASGNNSLTLDGTFYLGICSASVSQARILLSAFAASDKAHGSKVISQRLTFADLRDWRSWFR